MKMSFNQEMWAEKIDTIEKNPLPAFFFVLIGSLAPFLVSVYKQ